MAVAIQDYLSKIGINGRSRRWREQLPGGHPVGEPDWDMFLGLAIDDRAAHHVHHLG
jgi:hypothetical protein